MKERDALLGNPFAVLGASPRDGNSRLIELAEDAALFGDASANEKLNRLLQASPRLEAELSWFPRTEAAEVAKVLQYARGGVIAPVPAFRSPSALARFNACRLFLSYWPVQDVEDALALFKALIIAERPMDTDHTVAELREDRGAAGVPGEIDRGAVAARLEALRHRAAQQALEACEDLGEQSRATVYNRLAKLYGASDPMYRFNPFLSRLVEDYALSVAPEVQRCLEEILRLRKEICEPGVSRARAGEIMDRIATLVERWTMLHGPTLHIQVARQSLRNETVSFIVDLAELTRRVDLRYNAKAEPYSGLIHAGLRIVGRLYGVVEGVNDLRIRLGVRLAELGGGT